MTARKNLLTVLSVLAACAAGGCHAPILLYDILHPMDTVKPKFELPADQKILVFPDDLLYPVSYPPLKREMAEAANKLLMEKGLAANVVPYEEVQAIRQNEPDFNRLSLGTIGRKAGADLVVYVSITGFSLKDAPMDTLWRGRLDAKVRVCDVNKGLLWPEQRAGFPVQVLEEPVDNPSDLYGADLSRALARKMATEVVALFHEKQVNRHRPPPPPNFNVTGE